MNVKTLKEHIVRCDVIRLPIVLVYSDNTFVIRQYYNQIASNMNKTVLLVDDIEQIRNNNSSLLFDLQFDENLYVYSCESFDNSTQLMNTDTDVIIICKRVSDDVRQQFSSRVVDIPVLENWQIKDYVYSQCEGVDVNKLDDLLSLCEYNIDRVSNECKKLNIFTQEERMSVFDKFTDDGIFSDLSVKTIFDLSTAIIKRDKLNIYQVLKDIDKIDIEPVGLQKVLIDNFRDIIRVQLGKNITPEYCEKQYGWKKGKYWAIKYSCGYYTKQELLNIFKFLSSMKFGDVPDSQLILYIISHIIYV